MEALIRCARMTDKDRLIAFLEKANLGTDGVEDAIEYFLILEDEDEQIQATIGIEPLGTYGLLRSLAMTQKLSENELLFLLEQMLKLAREKKLESLYLATNKRSSLSLFSVLGFEREDKENLPNGLFASEHVKHIMNVDNSLFMRLKLE
ncbi:hypothetical protein PZE06_08505 [Robertmurraya sp. DFI.2.37]|uniref:GNAT family N-acetyltransferase n=1 Tax=Robertmurraya sp. DFI.2.37 TaxID=3031819 RepID=UPI001246BF33|nr:hypothetical protein [Robertmurraya sp. DFI.2.37]MDF1508225.1 hypothetical protein [Robertmurraya sp. DFI.2.37]